MDQRKALPIGTALAFPGLVCTIEEEIGRGSNAIVYKGFYADASQNEQRHTVLVKELFPFHPQNLIYRSDDNSIARDAEGDDLWTLHRQSFEHGNSVHLRLLEQMPQELGANLNTFALNGTLYSVLGHSGGRSLQSRFETDAPDLRGLAQLMIRLLQALDGFHSAGFLHLDVAPDNVLLAGRAEDERVILIDYNSVGFLHAPLDDNSYFSIKDGYTAPEICSGRFRSLGISSDLYSVAAIFYRGLMGRPLTLVETLRPAEIDAGASPLLDGQPDTVATFVNQLLRQGLHSLPKRRYASARQMCDAFQELLNRIDGVGVTHWALWESARLNVSRMIQENPSLAYLQKPNSLYPSSIEAGDGTALPAGEAVARLKQGGESFQLIAPGGMGKTTALLHAAAGHQANYAPTEAAVLYLSLYGWQDGQRSFILDRMLESLRFGRDVHNYEDARHALRQLLGQTLPGGRPVAVLLLDGFNEAAGAAQQLSEEIASLAAMPGVRLLVSTRTPEESLPLKRLQLAPLTPEAVEGVLADNGLLIPQHEAVRELLRTPMMLSIFVQSALANRRQPSVSTREELLASYFSALVAKEGRDPPADSAARWQADVAVSLVLPAIAAALHRNQAPMDDRALLKVVERCYRLLRSSRMLRAFPQWIGLTRSILDSADNAEQWYGMIVRDLLWKRMGLLFRDQQEHYQISHQVLEEYLLNVNAENQQRAWKRRLRQGILTGAAVLCAVVVATAAILWTRRPVPYDPAIAEELVIYAEECELEANEQTDFLSTLVEKTLLAPDEYARHREQYQDLERLSVFGGDNAYVLDLMDSGDAFAWYGRRLDKSLYRQLMNLYSSQKEEYVYYVQVLSHAMTSGELTQDQQEAYLNLLQQLLQANQHYANALRRLAVAPADEAYTRGVQNSLTAEADRCLEQKSTLCDQLMNSVAVSAYQDWEQRALGESCDRILQDWLHYLQATERIYHALTETYGFVDEFCSQPDWDGLLKSRTALSAAQIQLGHAIPETLELTATDEDYTRVVAHQLDIGFLQLEMESYPTSFSTARYILTNLNNKLYHQVFLQPDIDLLKEKAQLEAFDYEAQLRYLALATSYLQLVVDEQTAGALQQRLNELTPVIASFQAEYREDAMLIKAKRNVYQNAEFAVDETEQSVDMLERYIAREEGWFERYVSMFDSGDIEGLMDLAVPLPGAPAALPDHYLSDGSDELFYYFWAGEDGSTTSATAFEQITTVPDGCLLEYGGIPFEDFLYYAQNLASWQLDEPLALYANANPAMAIARINGKRVIFQWEDELFSIYMPDGVVLFAPEWYLSMPQPNGQAM
ncbi:MAG: hypothetical protein IKK75_02955 [Clostridia bacterium]|nr:hypothetical protein [Clostridia bacterium]